MAAMHVDIDFHIRDIDSFKTMLPDVGSSIQFKQRRNVLFPEPDGPSTATMSPFIDRDIDTF